MTITPSTLLSLPIITTGTESGVWGSDVNNGLTSYLDIAIAGTLSLTSASFTANALTLANTAGDSSATNIGATTAQYAVLKVSSLAANVTITAPSSSRIYLVDNTDATYTVTIKASGQTGYTVATSTRAWVYYNGTDYVLTAAPSTITGNVTAAGNNAFTGANTFYNATGQAFAPASTNDGILVKGRAGGASSYRVTLTPTTLTASRTVTYPDADTTLPVATQVLTFSGPTAARTITLPDSNTNIPAATQTLTFSGPTAARTLTLPDTSFTVGYQNIPYTTDKTTSYSLGTGDVGKVIGVGTGGSITIPNSTFAAGDAVLVFNNTSAGITITCSTTTAYIAGTDASKASVTLATRGVANILFVSGTICVITGNVS